MTTQQLDAQVAEGVMGWKRVNDESEWLDGEIRFGDVELSLTIREGNKISSLGTYHPTADPAQAAEVLKRISPGREITFNQNGKGRWFVTVTDLATGQDWNAEGDTWEMVVCLVALEVCK